MVTGAGRGIGRAHALALSAAGYAVVVNDRGGAADGAGADGGPAAEVVAEIRAAGGTALASAHDVTSFDEAGELIGTVIEGLGRLDVVITNAGILRDRMLTSMTEAEWDAVIAVHLKGTYTVAHHAAVHWRARAKAGEPVDARLITTTSASGLFGNVSQSNYAAAKAGVAGFTLVAAAELAPYGVRVNCLSPSARTRLTEAGLAAMGDTGAELGSRLDPGRVAEVAVWLCGPEGRGVTGRVFDVRGPEVAVASGWHLPVVHHVEGRDLAEVLRAAVAEAEPNAGMDGRRPAMSQEPTP